MITGVADLCMMAGVALVGHAAGSLTLSRIPPIALSGAVPVAAFLLLMIGATAKAGAMPFHSWIPDAAIDAPAPFMAFVPAALEKLLGIYFLGRLVLELFALRPSSWLSPLLMVIGCATIVLAVLMALIQTDYKRLLSYHAISQVGYMILGIGTAVPVGIVGGLFHMVNHAMYKSCLFLTGGAVELEGHDSSTQGLLRAFAAKAGGEESRRPLRAFVSGRNDDLGCRREGTSSGAPGERALGCRFCSGRSFATTSRTRDFC